MKLVRKKEGKIVNAYRLGDEHEVINELMAQGLLKKTDDSCWRVCSQEATEGEIARDGDYIKVDSSGHPYPNVREYFEKNHKSVGGDKYEQIPQILKAWDVNEPECPELAFLIAHKGLVIDPEQENCYYKAPLFGDILTADRNAEIVFYSIQYDEQNQVTDADFNFVAGDEFAKTYDVIGYAARNAVYSDKEPDEPKDDLQEAVDKLLAQILGSDIV
jgi:hypothetical protein